jgi:3-oxoacyl-[acyl-carrier-protein] synthase-3
MQAAITALEYYLPEFVLTNAQLAEEHPDWRVDELAAKLGIAERRIAAHDECSSDLAVTAAGKLFASGACKPGDIDFLLLCTQSPDYFLPTTACLVQHRLGIPTSAGAYDFNLGCSGFVYGLSQAKGLIETGQAQSILLLMADTYSKFMHPNDKSRMIFGDGASATLVRAVPHTESGCAVGPFCFGTDGRGAPNLMVAAGGLRNPQNRPASDSKDIMSGPELFSFASSSVPKLVRAVLERAALTMDDVDFFVFHQASRYLIDHLRKRLCIPETKFWESVQNTGNTVSSSVPIALRQAWDAGRIQTGQRILLAGFGVGYSWAGTMIRWTAERSLPQDQERSELASTI